jgi:hypothetical protein
MHAALTILKIQTEIFALSGHVFQNIVNIAMKTNFRQNLCSAKHRNANCTHQYLNMYLKTQYSNILLQKFLSCLHDHYRNAWQHQTKYIFLIHNGVIKFQN